MNSYTIKWAILVSVSDKGFNRNYRAALKANGFSPIGKNNDVYVNWYNGNNPLSTERMNKQLSALRTRIGNYKNRVATLSFTITDKQFGMIGRKNIEGLKMRKVPTSAGLIPVTTRQFITYGNWMNIATHKL